MRGQRPSEASKQGIALGRINNPKGRITGASPLLSSQSANAKKRAQQLEKQWNTPHQKNTAIAAVLRLVAETCASKPIPLNSEPSQTLQVEALPFYLFWFPWVGLVALFSLK